MHSLRYERGATTSALSLETANAAANLADMAARRKVVDDAMAGAGELIGSGLSDESTLDLRGVTEHYERWVQTRREADAALAKPLSGRDAALSRRIAAQATDLLRAIEGCVFRRSRPGIPI